MHKPIIRKFKKRKGYLPFIDYTILLIADRQLISKFNKRNCFLLCVIDIFSKYAWVIILKDKKGITITNAFQKILDESNCKPSKIWVDTGIEFYNRSMKSWLEKNAIEMCSRQNKGKSVVAERFIRTLKNKIYEYMTSISKSMYIDKLDDIVHKYNNTYHRTIKMRPVDVKPSMYINFNKENNKEDPKFKVGDHVKSYVPNWSEEVFVIKKAKNIVSWTYGISDLNGKEIVGTFYKKNCKKQIRKSLELNN